jgi:hypothetical protein
MDVPPYGTFSFGNILKDDFVEAVEGPKFRSAFMDIQSGINHRIPRLLRLLRWRSPREQVLRERELRGRNDLLRYSVK